MTNPINLYLKINQKFILSSSLWLINGWCLLYFFDEIFVSLYTFTILPVCIYFSFKNYKDISYRLRKTIKHDNIKIYSIFFFIAIFSFFLTYTYIETLFYDKIQKHYIIGYSATENGLKLINQLDNNSFDKLPELHGNFSGDNSILDIWNWPGVVFNRIVIIILHLLSVMSFQYIAILNVKTKKIVQLRLLFLASNSILRTLELGLENECISHTLLVDAECRDYIEFEPEVTLNVENLMSSLTNTWANAIHYSGHSNLDSIEIRGFASGKYIKVTYNALGNFLSGNRIKLIVLNSCSSFEGAKILSRVAVDVIGTLNPLNDSDAIRFSRLFYLSIGMGKSVKEAFNYSTQTLKEVNPSLNNIMHIHRGGFATKILDPSESNNVYFHIGKGENKLLIRPIE